MSLLPAITLSLSWAVTGMFFGESMQLWRSRKKPETVLVLVNVAWSLAISWAVCFA